jgi:hypothetical protein
MAELTADRPPIEFAKAHRLPMDFASSGKLIPNFPIYSAAGGPTIVSSVD